MVAPALETIEMSDNFMTRGDFSIIGKKDEFPNDPKKVVNCIWVTVMQHVESEVDESAHTTETDAVEVGDVSVTNLLYDHGEQYAE